MSIKRENFSPFKPIHPHERKTVYEIVLKGAGETEAERYRYQLADFSLRDQAVREAIDARADAELPHLEETVRPTVSYLKAGNIMLKQHLSFKMMGGQLWGLMLEIDPTLTLGPLEDQLAGMVAAEIWLNAMNTDSLGVAASAGPDAVSSLGAIMARVTGHGEEARALPGSNTKLVMPTEHIELAVLSIEHNLKRFEHLVPDAWDSIVGKVVTDLLYQSTERSCISQAAYYIANRELRKRAEESNDDDLDLF